MYYVEKPWPRVESWIYWRQFHFYVVTLQVVTSTTSSELCTQSNQGQRLNPSGVQTSTLLFSIVDLGPTQVSKNTSCSSTARLWSLPYFNPSWTSQRYLHFIPLGSDHSHSNRGVHIQLQSRRRTTAFCLARYIPSSHTLIYLRWKDTKPRNIREYRVRLKSAVRRDSKMGGHLFGVARICAVLGMAIGMKCLICLGEWLNWL